MAATKKALTLPSPASGGGSKKTPCPLGWAGLGPPRAKETEDARVDPADGLAALRKAGLRGDDDRADRRRREISPSTFFNYFPTKEDVVLYDAYDPMAIRMFLERPKDEPLNIGLRKVLESLAAAFERDERMVLARGRFFLEVPELRARMWDEVERTQLLIVEMLAERSGRRPDDFELLVTARIVIAALLEASKEWMRSNGRTGLVELTNRALDVVESGARLSAVARAKPRRRRRS